MNISEMVTILDKYNSGASWQEIAKQHGIKSWQSVVALKRGQIDRGLDIEYVIKPDEILKPCLDIPFYVSNYGNIFNVLKQKLVVSTRTRYATMAWNGNNYLVHRLVCGAFLGKSDLQVNHVDGNKLNNRIENLEYCTAYENMKHSREVLGNLSHGEYSGNAILTDEIVKEIYNAYQPRHSEFGMRGLAQRYNVDLTTIHLIVNGKTWTHVTGGIKKFGNKNPRKLSDDAIADIRSNYTFRGDKNLKYFAQKYNVCTEIIRRAMKA